MKILLPIFAVVILGASTLSAGPCGDVDGDNILNFVDVGALFAYLQDVTFTPSNIDSGNVDGSCLINVADVSYLADYLFGGPPLMCADTATCTYPDSPGNSVAVGQPPYTVYPGGDSMAIPIYFSNSSTLYGLSLGFHYSSTDIEITSVDWTGSAAQGEIGHGSAFDTSVNDFLIFDVGDSWGVTSSPQQGGLLAILNAQILSGNPEQEFLALEPVFYPRGGDFIFVPSSMSPIRPSFQAPIVVSNLDDSCEGSLRWAIEQANTTPGPDDIHFSVSGTINPATELPYLTDDSTTIDGGTAPGGAHSIVLDGTGIADATGLTIFSNCNEFRGLTLIEWESECIRILGDYNTIAGCHINVNQAGDTRVTAGGHGIRIIGDHNNIGGCSENDRNIISSSDYDYGFYLYNCRHNYIVNNYIGLSVSGDTLFNFAEEGRGFRISGADSNNVGDPLCLPNYLATDGYGMFLEDSCIGNQIANNVLGLTVDHADTIPSSVGIELRASPAPNLHNIIGPDNLIVGITGSAIRLSVPGNDSNVIIGNTLADCDYGISITSESDYNIIGGYTEEEKNIIIRNSWGISILSCSHNSIIGNRIGGDWSNPDDGNGWPVYLSGAYNSLIDSNTIAFNGSQGVILQGPGAQSTITRNLIYNNGLGIDLARDGVTENDLGDIDTGPNDLLNFPEVDSLIMQPDSSFIVCGFMSDTGRVEFFVAHPAGDTLRMPHISGHGHAHSYIGPVATGSDGTFQYTLANDYAFFSEITMTATDTFGNTSEFSENFTLTPGPLIIVAYRMESPVNMMVTDPEGYYIGKDSLADLHQNLFPATYTENAASDSVNIRFPKLGTYAILVYGEKTTKDGGFVNDPKAAAYHLGIRIDGSMECIVIQNSSVPSPGAPPDDYSYDVEEGYHYLNGDADRSEGVNLLDATFIINYLYKNGPEPYPVWAADSNCDLWINLLDATYIINYLYKNGAPPCDSPE
jgi:hypothetical protein